MLELKNINYSVFEEGKEKQILKDVNLKIEDKKITVITGQNGSGKSTLIKLIMGLELATSGKIIYNGQDITKLDTAYRANNGFTLAFQQPVKFKGLTIKDLLDTASRKESNVPNACEYLSMVGLCARDYLNRPLDDTLSGGELKRIELAIALAKGGDVFLFDEPEAGIDLWSFDALINIFKKLKGKTVIIVSHQQKILDIADNILILSPSRPLEYGPKQKLLNKIKKYENCGRLNGGKNE